MSECFSLQEVHQVLQKAGLVRAYYEGNCAALHRVHTDTRSVMTGDLFLALKGENFDANNFLLEAKQAGAVAAIAHDGLVAADLAGVEVSDTKLALGHLAAAWRDRFPIPLIAVVGSNGKTTVTQMVGSVLQAAYGEAALITKGNPNNDIGVPLTLLRLRSHHRIGVIELGMNRPGEIAYLANLVHPQLAIVNNAQREHQEFMHSVDAVAQENAAVIAALDAQGCAIFPKDEPYALDWMQAALPRKVQRFALDDTGAEICGRAEWEQGAWRVSVQSPAGAFSYRLSIAGRHNVKNSLAAVTACLNAGIAVDNIVRGLENFIAVKGRSLVHTVLRSPGDLAYWIDDTYNANPDSVCAAIDVLAELPGPHLLVLGDMGEVGAQGAEYHTEVGEYAAERGLEMVYCLGELARYTASSFPEGQHFQDMSHLITQCLVVEREYRSILVKGSRFMKMERLLEAMRPVVIETSPPLLRKV